MARFPVMSALVAPVALVLLSCGSGGTDANCVSSEGGEVVSHLSDSSTTAELTIAEILESDPRFGRLVELAGTTTGWGGRTWLEIWELPGEAHARGGVTVFAPTDDAFSLLDQSILDAIGGDVLGNDLQYIWLGHHYVPRPYSSPEFTNGAQQTFSRSPSGPVELSLDPPTWGGCPILETDLEASNGFIHVVGGVVIPDAVQAAVGEG